MTLINRAMERLNVAEGVPGILDAACGAFVDMLTVVECWEDPTHRLFTTYVAAGMIVANGRDAVLRAPSLPARRPRAAAEKKLSHGATAEDDARQLAALSAVIADRLSDASATATQLRDRIACEQAARSARNLHALFAGTDP
jgi:hypothetical protein